MSAVVQAMCGGPLGIRGSTLKHIFDSQPFDEMLMFNGKSHSDV